jgi:hypothetical protein
MGAKFRVESRRMHFSQSGLVARPFCALTAVLATAVYVIDASPMFWRSFQMPKTGLSMRKLADCFDLLGCLLTLALRAGFDGLLAREALRGVISASSHISDMAVVRPLCENCA